VRTGVDVRRKRRVALRTDLALSVHGGASGAPSLHGVIATAAGHSHVRMHGPGIPTTNGARHAGMRAGSPG